MADNKKTHSKSTPTVKYNTMQPRNAANRKASEQLHLSPHAAIDETRLSSVPTVKYPTMQPLRSSAHRKASEPSHLSPSAAIDETTSEQEKGRGPKQTDDEDVVTLTEQSEEKQKPRSETPDNPDPKMTKSRSVSTEKYNTMPATTSSKKCKPPTRSSEKCQLKNLRIFLQRISESYGTTIANKSGADTGNGQQENGAEGDQPDIAPQTLQPTPVFEVVDQASVNLVHEITFRELSKNIGKEWGTVATYLGVGEKRLEHIKIDYPNNISEQIFRMLVEWKSSTEPFGSSSFLILADNLERVGRKRLADELRGHFDV